MRSITTLVRTYNHARFIQQAIRSVQQQNLLVRHEIVIIDDFSTDGTRDVLSKIRAEDRERIRLVLLPRNEFSNRALAAEIERATGSCIAFIDGDDYWTDSQKLQTQLEQFEHNPQCTLSFHNAMVVDEDGSPIRPYLGSQRKPTATLADILERNFIPNCSAVVRTDACHPLPSWYLIAPYEDWPLWIIVASRGEIRYLDRSMASYREHGGGLWTGSSRIRRLGWDIQLFDQLALIFEPRQEIAIVKRRSWQKLYDLAVESERVGDIAAAAACLRRCLASDSPQALEQHLAACAVSPRRVWRMLKTKYGLYSRPFLTYLRYRFLWLRDEALPEVLEPPL